MIIGLTGGIGSGKSTIARALAAHGYTIYDCDREAKRIICTNTDVRYAIIDLLGTQAFTPDPSQPFTGVYNTTYVAQQVFAHPDLLSRLNAIVHPAVRTDILSHAEHTNPLIIESAILFEAGLDTLCSRILIVDAPEPIRIARTIARDYHGDASEPHINKVHARIHAQRTHADLTATHILHVNNDGNTSITLLAQKIDNWLKN